MKYLKKFPNHEGYSAYSASTVYLTPNVSLCDQEDEVHYGSNSEPPTPPVVHVDSVSVSPTSVTLNVGATTALTATVLPANATDKSVTWSSSDASIATVDANGVVTAIAVGNATITVTTVDGGKTAQCAATVEAQPQPTNFIAYTATSQLNADLTAFTPAAISETYDSTTHTGVIGFNAPVTAIGDRAFVSKDALISIVIPDSVTSIGPVAFAGCSGMTSCTIGSGVRSIGDSAFGDCRRLASAIIPNGVTSIGNFVFGNCFSLTSVTIPDSVTTIGPSAFGSCRNLTSISLPNSITEIGNMAFYECFSLTSINIPTGITSIDNYVFQNCTSLLSVDIPSGVTSIGHSALNGCTSLTSITCEATTPPTLGDYVFDNTNDCKIYVPCENVDDYKRDWSTYEGRIQCATPPTPTNFIAYTATSQLNADLTAFTPAAISETYDDATQTGVIGFNVPVTAIGDSAFLNKGALTSIDIPSSVTSIGQAAFANCSGLTSIDIPTGITSINFATFSNCSSLTSIDIPSGVTSIGNSAFVQCSGLTSIVIPDSVTSIGVVAFAQCSSLTSINIPSGVTSIGDNAFTDCSGLTSIDIPDSVTSIGIGTFGDCTSLASCTIGSGVTSIGNNTFEDCTSLTSIAIPNGVTSIGNNAFTGCTSLTSIDIPSGVTSIGNLAFGNCTSFTSITCEATTPPTLGIEVFLNTNDCPIYVPCESVNDYKSAWSTYESRIQCPPQPVTATITYTAANKLNVALSAFAPAAISEDYDSATQTGVIGFNAPVTEIGVNAFGVKYDLMSIELPNSVTTIGNGAFGGCTGLTSAIIGNGVTSIGGSAFMNCPSLTSIDIPSGVTSIGNWAFSDCTSLTSITVKATTPPTLGNSAFANTNDSPIYVPCESVNSYKSAWSAYAGRIQCATPPAPTTAITYTADNQIDVTSSDFMPEATGHSFNDGVGIIEFPLPVTSIGDHAFSERSIKSINIPDSVTSIGYYAFDRCNSLTSISIPSGVTSIGDGTFRNCESLTSIDIPNSVTSIGDGAFTYCDSLANVTIGSGIRSINEEAFYGCYDLNSITVKATIPPTLGDDAFDGSTCSIYVPCESVNAYKADDSWGYYSSRITCKQQPTNAIIYTAPSKLIVSTNSFTPAATGHSFNDSIGIIVFDGPVTAIGVMAFQGRTSLESIDIPNSVTSIGEQAFYNCTSLQNITVNATTPPTLGSNALDNTNNCTIYVPDVEAYGLAEGWSNYSSRLCPMP